MKKLWAHGTVQCHKYKETMIKNQYKFTTNKYYAHIKVIYIYNIQTVKTTKEKEKKKHKAYDR